MKQFISKLGFVLLGTAALAGCGVPGVPQPPSLELPQPVTDLRAVRKGDSVYLVWTVPAETTDGLAVRYVGPTRICRSLDVPTNECVNSIGEAPTPQPAGAGSQQTTPVATTRADYTDNLPPGLLVERPDARIFYAISVLNGNGRSAGISNIAQVTAVAALPPPSDFRAQASPEGIILSWTGVPHAPDIPEVRYTYRVYRRPEGGNTDTVAGELPLDSSSPARLVDHSFEWEGTYSYRATVVMLIHQEGKPEVHFEGADTPAVKVFAHDVFPPGVPSGLQAVFSGTGQPRFIDLIWAPDTDADLAGYNVFRHQGEAESVKINSTLVKTPGFRDMNVTSGNNYFYSVSAVDVRANESARSLETSEAVP